MKQIYLQKQPTNKQLILLFAGWGMDENLLAPLTNLPDFDCCICYDYTDLSFDYTQLSQYSSIKLYAWSMGVWVAATTLQGKNLPIVRSLAINGTHYPIDLKLGIAPNIFKVTLNNISPTGMQNFYQRICGNNQQLLAIFNQHTTKRSIESLYSELAAIERHYLTNCAVNFAWQAAIIGKNDRIFFPAQQIAAWQGTTQLLTADHHYLDLNALIENDRQTKSC